MMLAILGCTIFFIYRGDLSELPTWVFLLDFLGFYPAVIRRIVQSKFRKSPFHNQQLDTELSDTGLIAISINSESRLTWTAMTKVRLFRDGLLIFHGPELFRWLPDAALVSCTPEQAHSLVRSHVTDYAEVDSRSQVILR